jgi:autotransporter-associated beta strand protein
LLHAYFYAGQSSTCTWRFLCEPAGETAGGTEQCTRGGFGSAWDERGCEKADPSSAALGWPAVPTREWRNARIAALLATTALVAVAALLPDAARAHDSTWSSFPSTGNFNNNNNWIPTFVPIGTAFFGTSNITSLSFSFPTTSGGWIFKAGASNYNFTNDQRLQFNGAGITINGGSATISNNSGGSLQFFGASTADSATITNNTASTLSFDGSSTAANAIITNNSGGITQFFDTSTAGSAAITNQNALIFKDFSTAGNANIANGHNLFFNDGSTGGNAAITNASGALMDISGDNGPAGDRKLTAGSIAGAGSFVLGADELTVGGNNLSTEVSGVISGFLGSLVKAGNGTLTLSGTNTYTGGTTIRAGTLQLGNGGTSGSVVGDVVTNGTLAINRSDTFTFGNMISGTGAFVQAGPGTTILTGNNGYAGPTTVTAGTLRVSGSIAG